MAQPKYDAPFLQLTDSDFAELAELMRHLRAEKQDHLFVPVAKLQMAYVLDAITRLEASNSPRLDDTVRFGRGVAFNIASFTWPGWGDQPEPISPERQKLGRQAADLCLMLAERLGEVTPNSLWIVGAHQLNAREFDSAYKTFERAKQAARNDFFRDMHTAWQRLTRLVETQNEENAREFTRSVEKLRTQDEENADFYADQLITAESVFRSVADE